jgi:dynein regulatory complex protein 1
MLRRSSAATLAGENTSEGASRGGSGGGTSGKRGGADSSTLADRTAEARRADKEYWQALVRLFPARKMRVLRTLETGLTKHHGVLLHRKELLEDVDALTKQNAELKELLKQYLGAPINEDLIIPPTQMQLYTTSGK